MIKKFIDTHAGFLAVRLRRLRDNIYYKELMPQSSRFGLMLLGDDIERTRADSGELKCFLECLDSADVLVDVGANSGYFSCIAAKRGKTVVAIEPLANNCSILLKNLLSNGLQHQVEVLPVAVSSECAVLELYGGRQGASLLRGWGGIQANYRSLVPVWKLDSLVAHRFHMKRMLIKIDVEGSEMDVLSGAAELMKSKPSPVWIVENGLTENFDGGINPNFEKIFNYFWGNGYYSFTADENPRQVLSSDVSRWLNAGRRDFGGMEFVFRAVETY